MKNILTIDFDIVMAPCIELYNNMVPDMDWDIMTDFPQGQLFNADLNLYQFLTNKLLYLLEKMNKEDIFVIEDHGQIIKYLNLNEKINIYNIDHHHDCGYPDSQGEVEEDVINCGNWGLILSKIKILNNFYWIRNDNSDIPDKDIRKVDFIDIELSRFNFESMPIPDKLILCLSEPWVPPYIRPLFFTWLDIANKYYNTKFEIDYTRCNGEKINNIFDLNKKL